MRQHFFDFNGQFNGILSILPILSFVYAHVRESPVSQNRAGATGDRHDLSGRPSEQYFPLTVTWQAPHPVIPADNFQIHFTESLPEARSTFRVSGEQTKAGR